MHSLQVRLLLAETSISLEPALAAAEQVASHGIIESEGFEGLMTFLQEAVIAVDKAKAMIADGEGGPVDMTPLAFATKTGVQRQQSRRSKDLREKMAKIAGRVPAIRIISNQKKDD